MPKLLIFFVILLAVSLQAGPTGTISGRISDEKTGEALAGVTISIEKTSIISISESSGMYELKKIKPGKYTLVFEVVGYAREKVTGVRVIADSVITLDIQLQPGSHETVTDQDKVEYFRSNGGQIIHSMGKSNVYPSISVQAFEDNPDWNTEEYSKIDESGYFDVLEKPLSTFAADVDAASYANARRFIMQDQMPYKDAVRSEEFINYFSYDYLQPEADLPLSINLEYGDCPWNNAHKLVHIGLQGKQLKKEEQKPGNLVFLIDVSGSMDEPKKLPLLKQAFRLLVEQLNPQDKVALVVYASSTGLVLPATPGSEKTKILEALDHLQAGGSTAGGAGIQLAYKVAKENFIKDGNNRVILATDGDFNVGISSTSELVRYIEEKRDDGIFLTILGFGMGNYKDDRLQELADRGNGNHAYIDNILEARKVLVNEITATLFTIAKDVKIQVEFNPAQVQSYRLIGYENRHLEDKDFKDDKKDAGEIGAGHTVTALYEIIPATAESMSLPSDLKYQDRMVKHGVAGSDEILTVKIRYKEPDGQTSEEFSEVLRGTPEALSRTSDNFRFSAAVAEFAMLLRDSEFKGDADWDSVKELAGAAIGKDNFGYRAEFINLVRRVSILSKTVKE